VLTQEGTLPLAAREVTVFTQGPEFSRVFEKYHGLVFRTAYRITGNAADAEDILQTIFLRMLRRDSPGTDVEKPESYLRRAAINASVDLLRARQSERSVPLSEVADGRVGESYEMKRCLRLALARLTPRSAEIFALRYFEDCSNQEIARALNMSQVLVAVTLHRTRRQLQKEIQSCLGDRYESA
jgi:RNA polymerase sigma-70 factor, ECF subfamily